MPQIKGCIPWNKGIPRSEETRKKISQTKKLHYKKENHPNYGKHLSNKTKARISNSNKGHKRWLGRQHSMETKKKMSEIRKGWWLTRGTKCVSGENNPMFGRHRHHTQETKLKMAKSHRGKRFSEDVRQKLSRIKRELIKQGKIDWKHMLKSQNIHPNGLERFMIKVLDEINLPFRFVGNGSFWIGRKYNPDFIHTHGEKIAIEVFGDYWHRPDLRAVSYTQTEEGRREIFKRYGWTLIVFWQSELKHNAYSVVRERLSKLV